MFCALCISIETGPLAYPTPAPHLHIIPILAGLSCWPESIASRKGCAAAVFHFGVYGGGSIDSMDSVTPIEFWSYCWQWTMTRWLEVCACVGVCGDRSPLTPFVSPHTSNSPYVGGSPHTTFERAGSNAALASAPDKLRSLRERTLVQPYIDSNTTTERSYL